MSPKSPPDAWVAMPSEAQVRAVLPRDADQPYDFGFGFDDRGCLEVAHVVGIFNYLTRLADGFGLRLDAETETAGATGVALRRPVAAGI